MKFVVGNVQATLFGEVNYRMRGRVKKFWFESFETKCDTKFWFETVKARGGL
jgi:hypothetical protein